MFQLPLAIPPHLKRSYRIARVFLYVFFIAGTSLFLVQTFFPTLTFSFNFRTPSSSKNSLLDPHSDKDIPATNGKITQNEMFITTASAIGEFSLADISFSLEKKSALPNTLEVTLKRSYRSFFLPTGVPLTNFPEESLYRVDDTYYALRDGTLYPFVSDNAYLSRYPDTFAIDESRDFLANHLVSEEWIGYRVGSLVSFADGVFLIVSETEMRPFGSPEILLALGYRFEDVRPASEEEIGIYKRGRIILIGTQHPDGTLLLDTDTNTYYLIEDNLKHPLESGDYRNFIRSKQTPIVVSSKASEEEAKCTFEPGLFGQSFSCQTEVTSLHSGFGNDFRVTIEKSDTDIDISTLQVSFESAKSKQNMRLILSKIKQRLLSRFGVNQ